MMSLLQAGKILNAEVSGENVEFRSVSTDTRSIQSGDLYVALQGERFDGHDFVAQAGEKGAVAALIHKNVETTLPCLKVEDTRIALGGLAAAWRNQFGGRVVGVTGSNGKTTVKEMIAAILATQGEVLATKGNFNNDIGLPLTLLRMDKEDFAVIEMGANHPGEIAYLTELAQPDVALITNAGPAHLDGFGSLQGVAEAKGEIYQGLRPGGVAIVNKDDAYSDYWLSRCEAYRVISFGMVDDTADVYGQVIEDESGRYLDVRLPDRKEHLKVYLQVPGQHNLMNALAAISATVAAGVDIGRIEAALNDFRAVKGRLNIHKLKTGMTVIDDTYNANPASLIAGIEVLNEQPGEHWLVMGDMGELGAEEQRAHFDVGLKAREKGVDRLLATGNASRYAVDAFGGEGIFFESKKELVDYIKENRPKELGLLVKGSRFMRMEEVVNTLIEEAS